MKVQVMVSVFSIVVGVGVLRSFAQTPRGEMRVYSTDGLTRVRKNDAPLGSMAVKISAAQNEYEPFQIVVHASATSLKNVMAEPSDLISADGHTISRQQITLYREHYVEVTQPSPRSKEGAGWYPDALIPFVRLGDGQREGIPRYVGAPFNVEANTNQPVWADLLVPADASPGFYAGTVTVTAGDHPAVKVPVGLTVWNFKLPETPSMRSIFGGSGARAAAGPKVEESSKQFIDLEREYAEALAAHRLCPPVPRALYPKVKADGSLETFESEPALKEWMTHFHVTSFRINLLGDDPLGKDRERNRTYLRAMYALLKANGWERFAYVYVFDEPSDRATYELVRQRARLVHESQPGIKVLCTEQPTPSNVEWGTLVGSVDIWVPLWSLFEEKSVAVRMAAGEEVWSYTALTADAKGKDTPYWQIDFPLLNFRIPAWISWRYGVTGLLYWRTIYWDSSDAWTKPATFAIRSLRYNGEGLLLYPGSAAGFTGPVASMRLKQIREGLEDYEYLKLLAGRGQMPAARELAQRLGRSWTDWNANGAALYATREELARRIVAVSGPQNGAPAGGLTAK